MNDLFLPVSDWLNGITGLGFTMHGYIALVLGVIGVTALYAVLLYLMRLSHQSGVDDDAYEYRDPRFDKSDDEPPRGA